jgi:hypothetical protein
MITYLRLLDADADGADWREITQIVLHIDPALEPDRAREVFDSHLARAKWMTEHGYRQLLRGSPKLAKGLPTALELRPRPPVATEAHRSH